MSRLPNLFVLGPPRCGTTRLYWTLRKHDQVFMPEVKEPCFFAVMNHRGDFTGPGDDPRVRDWTTYKSLFAGAEAYPVIGDASPLYLSSASACSAIKEFIPDAKMIAILRDPSERAFSHYVHHRMAGRETCTRFKDALDHEEERANAGWSPFWLYKRTGRYGEQLARYFETFDRKQLRIYLFEDLRGRPEPLLEDLSEFLELDTGLENLRALGRNPSGVPRLSALHEFLMKPAGIKEFLKPWIPRRPREFLAQWVRDVNLKRDAIDPQTRRELIAYYRDQILQTQSLIDRDLSAWLE